MILAIALSVSLALNVLLWRHWWRERGDRIKAEDDLLMWRRHAKAHLQDLQALSRYCDKLESRLTRHPDETT